MVNFIALNFKEISSLHFTITKNSTFLLGLIKLLFSIRIRFTLFQLALITLFNAVDLKSFIRLSVSFLDL